MARLDEFLQARRSSAFAWGVQDCATFAADWVLECTGFDPMQDLRGRTSALRAMRALRDAGGAAMAAAERLGSPVPPLSARVGDVCLMRSGRRLGRARGWTFGICNGRTVAAPGLHGLEFVSITMAVAAWRV